MQTITIEVRIDFDTANKKIKEPIALSICKGYAKEILTKFMMIKDTRDPQISISDGDFFSTTNEVMLFDEFGNETEGS